MSRVVEGAGDGRWVLRIGRAPFWPTGAFLVCWLIGWAAGLVFILRGLRQAPDPLAVAIAAFWAVGGLAAINVLGYFLGEESLRLDGAVLIVRGSALAPRRRLRTAGIRMVRILPAPRHWAAVHRIAISHPGGEVRLGLGLDERDAREVADRLRLALGLLTVEGRPVETEKVRSRMRPE